MCIWSQVCLHSDTMTQLSHLEPRCILGIAQWKELAILIGGLSRGPVSRCKQKGEKKPAWLDFLYTGWSQSSTLRKSLPFFRASLGKVFATTMGLSNEIFDMTMLIIYDQGFQLLRAPSTSSTSPQVPHKGSML